MQLPLQSRCALIAVTQPNFTCVSLNQDHFCVTPFRRVDRMQTDAIRDFFLEHMFPHDVYPEADAILDAFQMFCGYRLTGETNVHQVWFMTGEGSNMKTQISRWLEETLGKHFVAILTAKNLDVKSSDNNDAIYTSRRKRMWNINESGTRNQWDDEMFKVLSFISFISFFSYISFMQSCYLPRCLQTDSGVSKQGLTGGESQRGVSAKYKNEAKFQPIAKMMCFINDLPKFTSPDAFALYRRCVVVHLLISFACNESQRENLLQKEIKPELIRDGNPLFYEEHMSQHKELFLEWLVEGAKKYYQVSPFSCSGSTCRPLLAKSRAKPFAERTHLQSEPICRASPIATHLQSETIRCVANS